MRSAVIVFPGSNCDRDAVTVVRAVCGEVRERGQEADPALPVRRSLGEGGSAAPLRAQEREQGANVIKVWHADAALPEGLDLVVVPGGFSYGDYLRSGAMAAHSPIMREVVAFAGRGGRVLGVCNGFQILTECGLLPGALLRNAKLRFLCREVHLRVENAATDFTRAYKPGQVISVPVAHHDGNYFIGADGLKALEDNAQIAFRYCSRTGELTDAANPNGSLGHIAGVFNKNRNVLGMMPHPERHSESLLGGTDGRALFEGLLQAAA